MNALIDAVATSILAEVTGANAWTFKKAEAMWRNPNKGKVLNIYLGTPRPGEPYWTGGTVDEIEIVVEYTEPAPEQARDLDHDVTGEYAANDVAAALRDWGLAHQEGFSPAHKMDWAGTEFTPQVSRQLFVRYCRVRFVFSVVKTFV